MAHLFIPLMRLYPVTIRPYHPYHRHVTLIMGLRISALPSLLMPALRQREVCADDGWRRTRIRVSAARRLHLLGHHTKPPGRTLRLWQTQNLRSLTSSLFAPAESPACASGSLSSGHASISPISAAFRRVYRVCRCGCRRSKCA